MRLAWLFWPIFTIILLAQCNCDRKPKTFTVDLDLSPQKRWTSVTTEFLNFVPEFKKIARELIPNRILYATLEFLVGRLELFLPKEMFEELKGISLDSGLPLADLTVANLLYEVIAFRRACTSVVAQDVHERILHGRNFDMFFTDLLRNLTIIVDFQRNNKTVYSGVTFAFTVGLFTGQRPGAFTMSINERNSGSLFDNIVFALVTRLKNPLAFELRKALENTESFEEAVDQLSLITLMAPVYIVLAGTQSDEGVVITRERLKAVDVWRLSSIDNRWYLFETNYDHWEATPTHDTRRYNGEKSMNATGQEGINETTMLRDVLSINPVRNDFTVYSLVMSPSDPDMLKRTAIITDSGFASDADQDNLKQL